MTDKARLLKIKARLKKRQPKFIRQDAHKHKRVKQVWRSPKGLHSKMRDSRRGYRVKIQGGYQTPQDVRGLDKHGLKPTIVATLTELSALDPKVQSVILKGTLGGRKRLAIIEAANAKKFTIINAAKDAAEQLKAKHAAQKTEKQQREAARSKKHEQLEEKAKKGKKDAKDAKSDEKADEHAGHDHAAHTEHDHKKNKTE
jgi:large subunit ribosomal protein L32e